MKPTSRRYVPLACIAALLWAEALNAGGAGPDKAALDGAFAALRKYEWGRSAEPLHVILVAMITSHGDPAAGSDLETRLISVFDHDATAPAKDFTCRQLAWIGTSRAVRPLAPLLADKELAHLARLALERIPDRAATDALCEALPKLRGPLQAGVIGSLAARCDVEAVPLIAPLVRDSDAAVARAALAAMGGFGTPEAVAALRHARTTAPAALRLAVDDALLRAAEALLRDKKGGDAAAIYKQLASDSAEHLRMAALVGLATACPKEAPALLTVALSGDNERMRGLSARLVRESRSAELVEAVAASLGRLPPAGQLALLAALEGRGEPIGRGAVLEATRSRHDDVKTAAARALGSVGTAADVPMLVRLIAASAGRRQREAAWEGLCRLGDPAADAAILKHLTHADAAVRILLIRALVERRAIASIPCLLDCTADPSPEVRIDAYQALQVLADDKSAAALLRALVRSAPGPERQTAERATLLSLLKTANPARRVEPVLAALAEADAERRLILLPLLGSLGGPQARPLIRAALQDPSEAVQQAGVQALANWPDASVAAALAEIARHGKTPAQRAAAVRGLARVAPRPAHLPPAKAFDYLKIAIELASQPEDKKYVLSRMAPVRTPECLAYVMSLVRDPVLGEQAIRSGAALAEGMKDSHPQQARPALETVLKLTSDEKLRAHVDRLLTRMTWKGK